MMNILRAAVCHMGPLQCSGIIIGCILLGEDVAVPRNTKTKYRMKGAPSWRKK